MGRSLMAPPTKRSAREPTVAVAVYAGMKTALFAAAALTLTACATPLPPPVGEPVPSGSVFNAAEARALAEADVQAALGPAAVDEIRRAGSSVLVRQGVSLPRMIQQPDGSWKPEAPRV